MYDDLEYGFDYGYDQYDTLTEEEYEDDGQPSEMDEWYDFDPDC